MNELHLTAKDFRLEWYSGTGAGGQHRNKHQNCCRIVHIATGITCNGTSSRSRVENQKEAFTKLARILIAKYCIPESIRRDTSEVIRNYHEPRNEVLDKESGVSKLYSEVVDKCKIDDLIEARLKVKSIE